MPARRRYRRRPGTPVTAIQLRLRCDGFTYEKWGGTQRCNAGDWLVDNTGDVFTVKEESFRQTYREESPGRYVKVGEVWALETDAPGRIKTKEGITEYAAGDYIVGNEASGGDDYAMPRDIFDRLYELAGE